MYTRSKTMGVHTINQFYFMKTIIRVPILIFAVLLLTYGNASAQFDTSGQQTLIIYQGGYSLVQDVRKVEIDRGVNEYTFSGFPWAMDFNSMISRMNGRIHDHRNDASRVGFDDYMKSLVGKSVRLDHAQGHSINGVLQYYDGGLILIKQSDGSDIMLPGLTGYTVSSKEIVFTPFTGPRLMLKAEPQRRGVQEIEFNYLVNGLSWTTEYALVIGRDEKTAQLYGWSIIQNYSDWNYDVSRLKLIAGQVNRSAKNFSSPDVHARSLMSIAATMESQDASIEPTAFSDFQLYEIPGTYDIRANESRRIPLVDADGIQVQKRYRYTSLDRYSEFPTGGQIRIQYDIPNTRRNKVGMALPSGNIKVYGQSQGQRILIGEDAISNIPVDGMIAVTSGMAFDLLVKETPISQNRITDRIFEQSTEVLFQNRKNETVEIELERNLNTNQRITSSSIPFEMVSSIRGVAKVRIEPGKDQVVKFTIRTER